MAYRAAGATQPQQGYPFQAYVPAPTLNTFIPLYWPQTPQTTFRPMGWARFPLAPTAAHPGLGLLGDGPTSLPPAFSPYCPDQQFNPGPHNGVRSDFRSRSHGGQKKDKEARNNGHGMSNKTSSEMPHLHGTAKTSLVAQDGEIDSDCDVLNQTNDCETGTGTGAGTVAGAGTVDSTNSSPEWAASKTDSVQDSSCNSSVSDVADTPINRLVRLCRFNRASSVYELIDEKGPAHLKVFVVKVTLVMDKQSEDYIGEGNSIRKAKHEAATRAALSPHLRPLPEKSRFRSDPSTTSPVARLNALALKMRSWADYRDRCGPAIPHWGGTVWMTSVTVYGKTFTGAWAASRPAARNLAAQEALEYFQTEKERKDAKKQEMASLPAAPHLSTPLSDAVKAPVSVLYEEARRLHLDVCFQPSTAEGPPHCQTFHVTCTVGQLESTGKGPTKKDARHDSAEKMLTQFRALFGMSVKEEVSSDKRKSASAVKTAKARPEYGKNINPVSRLYQLQQANDQPDPVFEVDASVEGRVKDFAVTARIPGGPSVTAVGPNKKLAKRFAAENLLRDIGFQGQPPIPQKSSIRMTKSPEEPSSEDRKVKFNLLHPESDDKANGRTYRKRFSKKPQPASMYPKNSVQETLFQAKTTMQPGREVVPGLISLPRSVVGQSPTPSIGIISVIARELMGDRHSPTAVRIAGERGVKETLPEVKDAWLPLLVYLSKVVNMTLKKETFSRQGPHAQYVTVLTCGEPLESIGCGNGATEEKAVEDAAWNLLTVIGEQGDENYRPERETALGVVDGDVDVQCDRKKDGQYCADKADVAVSF